MNIEVILIKSMGLCQPDESPEWNYFQAMLRVSALWEAGSGEIHALNCIATVIQAHRWKHSVEG